MKGIDKVDIKHFKLFELDDGGAWWIWFASLHGHSLKVKVQRRRLQLRQGFFSHTVVCMGQFTVFCCRGFVCQHFQEEAGRLESRCGFLKHQLLDHYIYKLQVIQIL